MVKKASKEPVGSLVIVGQPAAAQQSSSVLGKLHAPVETRHPLFPKRQKSIVHKLPRSEILDLIKDPPFSTLHEQEAPKGSFSLNPSTSDSLPHEGADSPPKAKTRYSANYLDSLHYTMDYDSIHDPLEVHGALTRHLIRVIHSPFSFSFILHISTYPRFLVPTRYECELCYACEEACEKERALQLQVKELKEENERIKVASTIAIKEKKALFTRLEGEAFDITQKLERLQLVHNQTIKKVGELEERAKISEEALPQRV
ncbi:hypothetical protein LIER_32593 [Lithospermum erythrorhizon]|uniref:Uncharacterized protein n=1 Tax=Lithospermum erythrorhizon TaxID=34254 RepID=A0AAV3RWS3_LITER